MAAILAVACCALLVHGAAAVWLNVKRRGMVEISDKTAMEVQNLFRHFIAVTKDIPRTNKNDNARRVAGKIIKYINNKRDGKKKEIVYPSRND